MFKGIRFNKTITVCTVLISTVLLFVTCVERESKQSVADTPPTAAQFAGSKSCEGCHKNIYESHILTPHYLTTRPASAEYIKGSFEPGKNRYAYDSNTVIVMEKRDVLGGIYDFFLMKGPNHFKVT